MVRLAEREPGIAGTREIGSMRPEYAPKSGTNTTRYEAYRPVWGNGRR